jgi:hypothetical protein
VTRWSDAGPARCAGVLLACVLALGATGCSDEAAPEPVRVQVSPAEAQVRTGETQQFAAQVSGSKDPAVRWSVVEQGAGQVGATGLYTAPSVPGLYTVRAQSVADERVVSEARVRVLPGALRIVVTVSPTTAELDLGEQLTLTATVTNAQDTSVTWSVEGGDASGTVSAQGVYTAPRTAGTYRILAHSVADPNRSAAATVKVADLGAALHANVTYGGTKTGRIYVTYGSGEVLGELHVLDTPMGTNSREGIGAVTVRPLRAHGDKPMMAVAWMDVLGTGIFNSATDPWALVPLTVTQGNVTVDLALADPQPSAPTPLQNPPGVSPGDGLLWVNFQVASDVRGESVEAYRVYWSDQPSPGPDNHLGVRTVGAGTARVLGFNYGVALTGLAPGTYYVAVATLRAGQESALLEAPEGVVIEPSAPQTGPQLVGTVELEPGATRTGDVYVVATDGVGYRAVRMPVSAGATSLAWSMGSMETIRWFLLALHDADGDGVLDPGERITRRPRSAWVAADGVSSAPRLMLEDAPARANFFSNRNGTWDGSALSLSSSDYRLNLSPGTRLPVRARLTGRAGLAAPFHQLPQDLPLFDDGFSSAWEVEAGELQLPEDAALAVEVTDADGTTGSFPLALERLPMPQFSAPGSVVNADGFTFAWTLPDSVTAAGFTQSLDLALRTPRGDRVIWDAHVDGAARSVDYAGEPLVAGAHYSWFYQLKDAEELNSVSILGGLTREQ